jgi:hypothetical protein
VLSDALDALQRKVPLATLNAAHIGAMEAKNVGERLLAEALRRTVGAQVAAHRLLEIAFHVWERSRSAT